MIDVSSEQIITLRGAADHLQCSLQTIRRMQATGLEVFRVGNRIRTSKEALHRYLHGSSKPASRGISHDEMVRRLREQS